MKKFYFKNLLAVTAITTLMWGNVWGQVTTNSGSGLAATYTSLANAITALNAASITSPVVITLTGNETAPAGGYSITAQGTSTNTIIIQGSGSTITAGVGTSTTTDAIFKLVGADYITLQNFTMQESGSNTTSTQQVEWGVALLHASTTNGSQNNTIQNNTITLNKTNLNTFGIYSNNNHSATVIGTTESVTNNTTGPASGNKIYGNTISNVNMGIAFIGTSTAANQDIGNDIGGTSTTTGNTITNWGGAAASSSYISNSGTSYCIYLNHQVGENVSYNTITSATISGTSITLRGIFKDYGTGATLVGTTNITNNTLTITDNFTSGIFEHIRTQGTVANTSTCNLNNNTILNSSMGGASSTTIIVGIVNSSIWGTLNMNNNIIRGITSTATTGGITGISNTAAVVTAINMNNNQLGNASGNFITFSAATSGTLTGITNSGGASTCAISISSNDIRGITHSVVGSSTHTYFINSANAFTTFAMNSNTFTNLTANTTGGVTFLGHSGTFSSTSTSNINNNSIVTAYNKTGSGGTIVLRTSSSSTPAGAVINFQNNNFSNMTFTGGITFTGYFDNDGGAPTKSITGNTFNNNNYGTGTVTQILAAAWNGNNTTISNNIITNQTTQGSITCIIMGGSGTSTLNTVRKNTITGISSTGTGGAVTAISSASAATTTNIDSNVINTLSSTSTTATVAGISTSTSANIYQNTINTLSCTGTTSGVTNGIMVTGGTAVNVYRNKIYDLSTTGAFTTMPGVNGIVLSGSTASTSANVYNNLIGDLRAAAANSADALRGLSVTATGTTSNYRLYNNTVYLNASSSGSAFGTTGIFHATSGTATTAALDLRNNMVINTSSPGSTGVVTTLRRSSTALTNFATTSNRNMYFAGTAAANRTIMTDGTNFYQTYGTYFTAVGAARESNSFVAATLNPATFFATTTGTLDSFLRPAFGTTTQAESGGETIALTSSDYSGATRPVSPGAAYDVGAFEFNGISPTPSISFATASPSLTSLCAATARTIKVRITTPSPTTITADTLFYSYNGGATTAVPAGTFISPDTFQYTIPVASPTTAIVAWSVKAVNSASLSTTFSGTSYSDEPNTGITATASATATSACAGSPDTLRVLLSKLGSAIVSPSLTTTTSATTSNPIYSNWGNNRTQFLILASELTSSGFTAGDVTALSINLVSTSATVRNNFNLKLGHTSASALSTSAFLSPTFTSVFSANYTPLVGTNLFTFSTPFTWDGSSNVVAEFCWDNTASTATEASTVSAQNTAFNSTIAYNRTSTTGTSICGITNTPLNVYTVRPIITLTGNTAPTPTSHNWIQNNTTVVSTAHPYTFSVAAGSNGYKDSVIINNCPVVSNTVTINNSVPAFAFTTVSSSKGASFCVSDAPTTLSTNASGGCTPYTYSWSGPGGASGTSATLSASVTGTYNVTVTDNAGTSITQSIAITVNNPTPSVTPQTKCSGATTFTLGATVATAGDSLLWYASNTSDTILATGANYTTPSISSTTTYYVEERSGLTAGLGNTSTPVTTGASAERGIIIRATSAFRLVSAQYYSTVTSTSGSVTVRLLDSTTGTQIYTKTINMTHGAASAWYTMNLDWNIPVGSYRLLAAFSTISVSRHGTGVVTYPFALGSVGQIVAGYDGAVNTSYNYFHNLSIQTGCTGTRVPVTATLNTPPALALDSPNFSVCKGVTTAAVSATAATVGNYTTYSWSPASGVNSPSASSTTFTPSSTTTYTLSGTDGSCSRTVSFTLTAADTPTRLTLSQGISKTQCSQRVDSLMVTGIPASGTVSTSSGTKNKAIPDNSTTGVKDTLVVSGVASGSTIDSITVNFNLSHAYLQDAEILLRAPNGKIISLAADQGPSGVGNYTSCLITSDNTASALSTTATPITGRFKANANASGSLINGAGFGTDLTSTFSDLFTTINGNWILDCYDDVGSDLGTMVSWSLNIYYKGQDVTWSPTTGIFTNSAATTPYSSGHAAKLYTKNTSTTKYYAQSQLGNCIVRDSIIDSANTAANMVTLVGATTSSAIAQCTDGGWTYYGTAANPDKLIFAIQKGSSGLTGESVSITIDGTNFSNFSSNGANQEHKSIFMKRSWDVTATPGFTPPVNVRFFYDATDSSDVVAARDADSVTLKGSNPNSLLRNTPFTWFKSKNTAYTTWRSTNVRGNQFTAGTYDILTPLGYGTQNGIRYVEFAVTSFSGGTGGAGFGPSGGGGGGVGLPVTWAGFDVETTELGNELTWKTASEQNTSHFEVEYSYDAMQWSAMSDQIPAAGNSADLRTYNYTHSDFEPFVYYRIKQVDLDGQFDYSVIKLAKRSANPSFVVKVYPIPIENDNMVNVSVKGIDKSPMKISMTDMTGKVIRNINFTPSSESIKESFDMSPLAPGIYFIEVQNGQGKEVFKVSR